MNNTICLIGCNYGVNVILESIKRLVPKIKILGISGSKERGDYYLDLPYYSNWKKMIIELKPKFVILAVPPYVQSQIIVYLMKHNIDFLCEKPITHNKESLKKIKRYNASTKSKILVDLNFLTIPAIQKMREIIANKDEKFEYFELKWYVNPTSSLKKSWKNDIVLGGGFLNNFFFHILSILNFWFDNKYQVTLKNYDFNFYEFRCSYNKINFRIKFIINKYNNLFEFKANTKQHRYILRNKSLDYHNNFKIYKNSKIIFRKNFKRNYSRAFATYEILRCYFENKKNKYIDLKNSINIQQTIFSFYDD